MYITARASIIEPATRSIIGCVCFVAEPSTEEKARIITHAYVSRKIDWIDFDQTETGMSIFVLQDVRRDGKLVCFIQIEAIMRCNSLHEAEEMYRQMVGISNKTSAN